MSSTENLSPEAEALITKARASKGMLYVAIASIVMLFSAFLSAYIVSKGGIFWVNISLPSSFWISTALILLSSVTVNMALSAIKKNNQKASNYLLLVTLLLGVSFAVFQWFGWGQMIKSGNYFVSNIMDPEKPGFFVKGEYGKDFTLTFKGQELSYKEGRLFFPDGEELNAVQYDNLKQQRNTASSYIYVITALHILHVLSGLLYLISVVLAAFRMQFSSDNYLRISLISIYWHFLDALWVILFLFFQFIH